MKTTLLISLFYLILLPVYAQSSGENWVPVLMDRERALYINVTGLSDFKGDEIFVWTMEDDDNGIAIDEIKEKIFKTKTYFLFNKSLNRYSILSVMYFDAKGNLLKSFSYEHDDPDPEYKYSSPVFPDSDADKILKKCLEFIPAKAESINKNSVQ